MASEALKEEYKPPRANVCGGFFVEDWAVSYVPVIKNGTAEYYEFESFSDVQTQNDALVVLF
jgi:hypothetical protein